MIYSTDKYYNDQFAIGNDVVMNKKRVVNAIMSPQLIIIILCNAILAKQRPFNIQDSRFAAPIIQDSDVGKCQNPHLISFTFA